MKKIVLLLSLAAILWGCTQKESDAPSVTKTIHWAEVHYSTQSGQEYQVFRESPHLEGLLNCLRQVKAHAGSARKPLDPTGSKIIVRLHYQDGSVKTYCIQSGRYYREMPNPWQPIREQDASRLQRYIERVHPPQLFQKGSLHSLHFPVLERKFSS